MPHAAGLPKVRIRYAAITPAELRYIRCRCHADIAADIDAIEVNIAKIQITLFITPAARFDADDDAAAADIAAGCSPYAAGPLPRHVYRRLHDAELLTMPLAPMPGCRQRATKVAEMMLPFLFF